MSNLAPPRAYRESAVLSAQPEQLGGEIATRLQSIYVFCQSYLLKARLDRDPAKIDRVSAMLGELRDAWATIEQQR